MDKKTEQKLLFQEFKSVSTDEWEKLIEKDLKGADYSKKLIWKTLEGIPVKPYYRAEDLKGLPETGLPGQYPFTRGTKEDNNDWLIRQDILFVDANTTAGKINRLSTLGVQSIGLVFNAEPEREELHDLLNAIPFDSIEMNFSGANPGILLEVIKETCKHQGISTETISGSLGVDPIGEFSLTGILGDMEKSLDQLADLIKQSQEFTNLRVLEINAKVFHNSGSNSIQELAYAMSQAVEYLDELTNRGVELNQIVTNLTFNFAIGSNYFFQLSKFRAARTIWAKILETYLGQKPEIFSFFHAETSSWNKTVYDPYVNLLRTTTEAMSSVLGGVDSLRILPFNFTFEEVNEQSERFARNQQILLKQEAYLNKVIDPAAGSYYLETLTNSLSEEGWKEFQNIEDKGGFVDAFLKGIIQDSIVTVAQERDMRIAQKRDILLGTNQYANPLEKIIDTIDERIVAPKLSQPAKAHAQPLIPYRGAEGFEKLRIDTEKAKKQPLVFLLTIGNLTMRKARAAFASNFFGCAGYKLIDNIGFSSIEEGLEKATESKADIVVLCSSDEEYAEFAIEAAEAHIEAELVIAGYPKEIIDQLHKAGICHFIHVKTNLLETLNGFNQLLGISQ